MAMFWADDFSSYGIGGQTKMLDGNYAELAEGDLFSPSPTLVADPDPMGAGYAVARQYCEYHAYGAGYPAADPYLRIVFPSSLDEVGGSIKLWLSALPSAIETSFSIVFADSGNDAQLSFNITPLGAFRVYRGHYRSTVLGTSVPILTPNAWHHIEWKVTASNSGGTVEIRVNGTAVISLTGQDTVAQTELSYSTMSFVGTGGDSNASALYAYYKDLILWDTTGSENNDFMGPTYIARKTVTADTSFTWTPSTGSAGWSLINEKGPSDSTYISDGWPAAAESYFAMENLPADVTSVRGIMLMGRMRKSDGGDCNVQMGVDDGTSTTWGADRAITTAYTYWHDILELNNTTASPFTPTEFNALNFVIKRTA